MGLETAERHTHTSALEAAVDAAAVKHHGAQKTKPMRHRGIEPRPHPWKGRILTIRPMARQNVRKMSHFDPPP